MSKDVNYTQDVDAEMIRGYGYHRDRVLETESILKSRPQIVNITLNVKNFNNILKTKKVNKDRVKKRYMDTIVYRVVGWQSSLPGRTSYAWKHTFNGDTINIIGRRKIKDKFKRVASIEGKSFSYPSHDIVHYIGKVQLNADGDIHNPKTNFRVYGSLSYHKAGGGSKSIHLNKVEFDIDNKTIIHRDHGGVNDVLNVINCDEVLTYVSGQMSKLLLNSKKEA